MAFLLSSGFKRFPKPVMKVSKRGLDSIVKHEAEVLSVYLDPIGLPTLGVGHLLTKAELAQYPVGTKITKEVSREFFAKDLGKFERAVESAVKVPINQNQFDALVSLAFNIGIGAFNRSSVVRQLNAGQPMLAANAFLAWNKAGGKVLRGLTNRREAERKLFLTPISAVPPVVQPSPLPDKIETAPATQPPITTEVVQTGNTTTIAEQTKGDAPDVPPTIVAKNGPLARWLFSGGVLTSLATSVWAFVTANTNVIAIAVVCITVLVIVLIFRGAITDAIRMQVAADPDKKNVS